MSNPRRARQEDRIVGITSAVPGWEARFVDDEADDGVWVQPVPVWALMQDAEGETWVSGIDLIGEGAIGRPCEEVANFRDYVFRPDRYSTTDGQKLPDTTPST